MKKLIGLLLCLTFIIPCAFAEEPPRAIDENDAGYAWLYEKGLVIAERFQSGLDCTWHSFLLSAANVPEQEMLDALSPLRMQDYNQPLGLTMVRAGQTVPDEMIDAWREAAASAETAKAARAALKSAELINTLAEVKVVKAAEEVLKTTGEAVRLAEEAVQAAEENLRAAAEAGEAEAILTAEAVLKLAGETLKAAEETAKAALETDKAQTLLAAKEAAKTAKEAAEAAKEAAAPAAETEEAETSPAAEKTAAFMEKTANAADEALKSAENAVKAEENAVTAARALEDLRTGKTAADDGAPISEPAETVENAVPDPGSAENSGQAPAAPLEELAEPGLESWDLDFGWDDLTSYMHWDESASDPASQELNKDDWFIQDDPERDLYHSTPAILNFHENDDMFGAISNAIRVTGIYTRQEPLDGPCYTVMYYRGLYALLITWYPAGDGFVSVNAQAIYSRSADALLKP